jgi:hypothetical protein
MTPQFGASLADDSRVIIYDQNIFIMQAKGANVTKLYLPHLKNKLECLSMDFFRLIKYLSRT